MGQGTLKSPVICSQQDGDQMVELSLIVKAPGARQRVVCTLMQNRQRCYYSSNCLQESKLAFCSS